MPRSGTYDDDDGADAGDAGGAGPAAALSTGGWSRDTGPLPVSLDSRSVRPWPSFAVASRPASISASVSGWSAPPSI